MKAQTNTLFALSAACLLLAGCATAYQPDGISGGYSDQRLADNAAQVSFRGNRFSTPESLHSYLLRRCADITLQNGYNYFVVVHSDEPNEENSNVGANEKYTASATIEMYKGNEPQSDTRAYDAAAVVRTVPVDEGENAEEFAPPPVSIANANAVSSSGARIPVVNPNALTNQPPPFEHF